MDNAIDQFQKAVDVAPDFLPAYQRLSDACKKSGDELRAAEVLEKAEKMREFLESKATKQQVQ